MADQAKNLIIGIFVIVAFAIVIFMLLFLHPSVGDEGKRLRVRFSDIDKISIGTRVNFGGKPVGEVADIRELQEAIEERIGRDGHVYIYELELLVDSAVNVFNTDEISLRTSGLLGERSVAITPLPPKEGQKLEIVNDQVIYANESGSVEDTIKDLKGVAIKLDLALDSISRALNAMEEENVWRNLGDSMQNLSDMTAALNKPDTISETLNNLHDVTEKFGESWEKVDELLDNLVSTTSNTKAMTNDGKEVFASIKEGKGSLGTLLMKDDLNLKISSLLSKGEILMNDVNHYGILFHLDKQWQRLRARRLNLLQKLCSPQEFRNFFNDEIDKISTSLSRVSMVLDETGCNPPCLLENAQYKKVFAELLRRLASTEEALKMYNQQVVDCEVQKTELVPMCCEVCP
ncbi:MULTISPECIES: MlaD family protein [Parachlamydia]|jgi:phospholipid/cholesterol/gamma-HCH transport system substrate-binding protein|uniref:Mce/MlaD domain-containing protein n=2 Tax=Parachlamydia acanthamoebae TaxID=83552 RepID=F8KW75_PARAV|nr:MlaD family protein [Parachlamydia acanthamoebae]EFB40904.1 hypothetical protein pah_c180o102 [Parachlamydia acanthamoebae str. Hall's coccus]KIA78455.1 hypothetical protein DB43_DY00060 [Parachlamydia acanthamoebae]CCB85769.1 putative uncharacterized protein [Parachlamydia acanthamoebae UV-7]